MINRFTNETIFSKSTNERLDYYGLIIRNRSNAVFLELSDPNTFELGIKHQFQ